MPEAWPIPVAPSALAGPAPTCAAERRRLDMCTWPWSVEAEELEARLGVAVELRRPMPGSRLRSPRVGVRAGAEGVPCALAGNAADDTPSAADERNVAGDPGCGNAGGGTSSAACAATSGGERAALIPRVPEERPACRDACRGRVGAAERGVAIPEP